MGSIVDYDRVFEIKKGKNLKKFFTIFLLFLVVAGIIFGVIKLFDVFSNKNKYDVYVEGGKVYAVSLLTSDNQLTLEQAYPSAVAVGSSGYIWSDSNLSYLIALIYPSEDMAKSVIASNKTSKFDMSLLSLQLPSIKYNLPEFTEAEVKVVVDCTNYMFDLINKLYDLTIALQLDNVSSISCASTINNYKGQLLSYNIQLEDILKNKSSSDVLHLVSQSVKACNILEKLVNDLLINTDIDNKMKYALCEYIYAMYNYY